MTLMLIFVKYMMNESLMNIHIFYLQEIVI